MKQQPNPIQKPMNLAPNIIDKDYLRKLTSLATRIVTIASFVFFVNAIRGYSQTSNTVFFMDQLPQSSTLNSAYVPDYNFYVGLPVLSSVSMGLGNNFIGYGDVVFRNSSGDSLITFLHPEAEPDLFLKKLQKSNAVFSSLDLSLFSAGLKLRNSFISFGINERFSFKGSLPEDFFILLIKGNEEFTGKEANFSSLGFHMNHYREYAFGYAQEISKNLTVGGKAKILFGKGNMLLNNHEISYYTNPSDYQMQFRSKITVNTSLPLIIEYDSDNKISNIELGFNESDFVLTEWLFNNKNPGFAFDLGGAYAVNESLTIMASVNDLGFITWNDNVYNFSMDGEFRFDGLDVSSWFENNDDDLFEHLFDSIIDIFSISDSHKPYTNILNTRLYLGGTYELDPKLRLGFLSRSVFVNNRIEQAVTISANSNLNNWFSTSISYSVMNNSYNNLGLGLNLRGGPFHFYMITDNFNALFMPHKTKSVNLWFGMNLVFGNKKKVQIQDIENE